MIFQSENKKTSRFREVFYLEVKVFHYEKLRFCLVSPPLKLK